MVIYFFFFGMCLGILLGVLINKYLFPILDIKLDVFQYAQTEKATKHHLNVQEMTMLFYREYPEAKEDYQGETHAIGFQYTPEEEYDKDEEYCKCEPPTTKVTSVLAHII